MQTMIPEETPTLPSADEEEEEKEMRETTAKRRASESSETGSKQNSGDRRSEMTEFQRNQALDAAEISIKLDQQEKEMGEAA